ncbi:adenylate kinase [Arthrobacter roseus]|uniref:adenylate kinase n=1 Tax=Arthrobacter roseus TaxID=136274 RepID=UPI0019628C84|nr:adenylate kinase [Arthrobacter roseus]MBM7848454.1 adenylate kinase family enzyme [Arthrobacter roseus]
MIGGRDNPASSRTAGPRRILFVGVTGSGKSTLATQVGALVGLPVHLVDEQVGWLPGWIQRSLEDQRRIALECAAAPAWVFDSAYGHYRPEIAEHAELIVCLDYPRLVSLGRLFRRSIRRVLTAEPVCNGNVETWTRLFSADSILVWHWRSFASKRAQMDTFLAVYGPVKVLRFLRPRQTRK